MHPWKFCTSPWHILLYIRPCFSAITQVSAIFCRIGLKYFMVTQDTIMCGLVMWNHHFDTFLNILACIIGLVATLAPKGLGPQGPIKTSATWWTSWANRYLKNLFSKIPGLTYSDLSGKFDFWFFPQALKVGPMHPLAFSRDWGKKLRGLCNSHRLNAIPKMCYWVNLFLILKRVALLSTVD